MVDLDHSAGDRAKALGISDRALTDAITIIANFAVVSANGDASLALNICLSASAAIVDSLRVDYDPDEVADRAREVLLAYLEAHKSDRPTIN